MFKSHLHVPKTDEPWDILHKDAAHGRGFPCWLVGEVGCPEYPRGVTTTLKDSHCVLHILFQKDVYNCVYLVSIANSRSRQVKASDKLSSHLFQHRIEGALPSGAPELVELLALGCTRTRDPSGPVPHPVVQHQVPDVKQDGEGHRAVGVDHCLRPHVRPWGEEGYSSMIMPRAHALMYIRKRGWSAGEYKVWCWLGKSRPIADTISHLSFNAPFKIHPITLPVP